MFVSVIVCMGTYGNIQPAPYLGLSNTWVCGPSKLTAMNGKVRLRIHPNPIESLASGNPTHGIGTPSIAMKISDRPLPCQTNKNQKSPVHPWVSTGLTMSHLSTHLGKQPVHHWRTSCLHWWGLQTAVSFGLLHEWGYTWHQFLCQWIDSRENL